MKSIITLAAILITTAGSAQMVWEKTKLTENVSISFPGKPLSANLAEGQKSFILKQADSSANYIVAVSDLQVLLGLDAAALEAEFEKEETWNQAKTTFISSMGPTAKLIKDEEVVIQNTKAMKLAFERKNDSGGINTLTVLIFVNGTTSMNVIFNNRGGKADKNTEKQFFDSIEIKG